MITTLDRIITRSIVTPLALIAARWKGVDNFAFGARLLMLAAFTMCPWGIWEAAHAGSMQLSTMFGLWWVGSVFLAGIAEYFGEHVYRLDAHVTYSWKQTHANQALVLSGAYRGMFLWRLWRVTLTALFVVLGVLAAKVPLPGNAVVPLLIQFTAFWFFWYAPAVERSVIEPHLYYPV